MRTISKVVVVIAFLFPFVMGIHSNNAFAGVTKKLADGRYQIKQKDSTPFIYGQLTNFPIVIDQPGSYVLTSNITVSALDVNAIEIKTDNVTLDLNGHSILGHGGIGVGAGIYAHDRRNITVLNGVVRAFNCYGVYLSGGSHQLRNMSVQSTDGYGIHVTGCNLTNCTSSANYIDGIYALCHR